MEKETAVKKTDKKEEKSAPESEKKNTRTEDAEKLVKSIKRSERSVKDYQFFLLRLAVFILVVWVLFFVVIGVVRMPSADMYPRIDSGDFVMYYRLDKDAKAQDVIVFTKEIEGIEGRQQFIGRVVAREGDTVEITEDDRLKVNGNTVIETNIFYPTPAYANGPEYPLTLGEGEYFVLVDSRKGGTDSRYFGPVLRDEIKGTVITIIRRYNL